MSSYEADLPHSAEDNLFEYLRDEGQEYKTDDLFSRNGQQFASGSFRKGDWYIKVAFLTKGEQVVFVTYTAAVSDIAGAEVCEADTIMKSIRLTEV